MGSAILAGVMESCVLSKAAGKEPRISKFIATVNSRESAEALRKRFSKYKDWLEVHEKDNITGMKAADIVMLACKPYMAETVLSEDGVYSALKGKLVISVLVGSPVKNLQYYIDKYATTPTENDVYIKRVMLNIAAEYGESMSVIETTSFSEEMEEISQWIFNQVGATAAVAANLFDIGGIIAGPSSAFLSVALDGILDGAVSEGLKRADAKKILTQSLVSLTKLLENGEHPAVLREKYSSPKGTTIAGLLSLEEDRVRYAFSKAVITSSKRSEAIGN
jgi:pyrroline-5-carboxylate reductase